MHSMTAELTTKFGPHLCRLKFGRKSENIMCAFQPSPADAGEKPRHTKKSMFYSVFFLPLDLKGSFVLQHLFCMSRSVFANFFVVVFNQIYANVKRGKNHRTSLLFLQLTNETVLLEHFSCFYRIFIIFFDAILQ